MKGSKAYSILGFRVPTTSVGAWGEGAKGSEGRQRERRVKGSEAYSILGFRVPSTSVGAWGEGQRGGEGEQRG